MHLERAHGVAVGMKADPGPGMQEFMRAEAVWAMAWICALTIGPSF